MTAQRVAVNDVLMVAGVLLLAMMPHLLRFPLVLSLAVGVCVLWRILGAMQRLPLPDREHRWLRIAKEFIALAAFIAVYVAYRGQLGREAGVELLAVLLGLKLLEMQSERDYYIVTLLCYFLVVTNFFYSQTMPTALYMLAVVILVTTVLIQFNTPKEYRQLSRMLRLSATMTAQAAPLMMLAFVLFPRLPGPLWGLPRDAFDAVTGLSDEMRIGEITRLGVSDEIAFRVEFFGPRPRARELYWRGPVLWKTDGRTWSAGSAGDGPASRVEASGTNYHYAMTLEAHNKRWLLGLDLVTGLPDFARLTADHRLLATRAVRQRLRYELTSSVDYRLAALSDLEREAALQLPKIPHPRAHALARQWRAEADNPQAIVKRALFYYRDNEFVYSLTPPELPRDSVDDFLFDTREGFCEHFAASFVVLMRAAGIPARVVTGYQGGEYNGVGNYLVVRQRDAHAWAEVYFDQRGWVRIDPTSAVAPERVSLGSLDALPRFARRGALSRDGLGSAFWSGLREAADAAAHGWNRWVLSYSREQQQRLLNEFGFEDWGAGDLIIALTLMLGTAVTALALLILRLPRASGDAVQIAYARFCARLARVGVTRAPSEAPLAFARRAMLARTDLAQEISAITRLYTQQRYAGSQNDTLARRVARFKPRRR